MKIITKKQKLPRKLKKNQYKIVNAQEKKKRALEEEKREFYSRWEKKEIHCWATLNVARSYIFNDMVKRQKTRKYPLISKVNQKMIDSGVLNTRLDPQKEEILENWDILNNEVKDIEANDDDFTLTVTFYTRDCERLFNVLKFFGIKLKWKEIKYEVIPPDNSPRFIKS